MINKGSVIEELILIIFNTTKDILHLNLILINKPMQLSVDQKIQAAIQPLINRITALEAENEKFKQQIATLHTATQPKTAHKPGPKPPAEPVERPQTVKGGRKKSIQNHETKPDTKTDKKPAPKKEEPKGQGEELKPENPKPTGNKTPVVNNKGISSPNLNKDLPVNKDGKTRSTTGTGGRVSTSNLNNKSLVGEKKPNHHEQKKEGEQAHEEKKEHASHEKVEHPKPPTGHNPKTPVVTKPKPAQNKKPVTTPAPVTGAKKGGKPPTNDKKKPTDPKVDSPKEETKEEHKQEHKQESKEEHKEETKQPELSDEVKQELKEEEVPQEHQNTEGEKAKEEELLVEQEHKQPAHEQEAL